MNDNINIANYWSAIDSMSTQSESCIPDYCHVCGSTVFNANSVPANTTYWQNPHSLKGMAQMVMFYDEAVSYYRQRDYLQGRLFKSLIPNKQYCFSMYVNLAAADAAGTVSGPLSVDGGSVNSELSGDGDVSEACFAQSLYLIPLIEVEVTVSFCSHKQHKDEPKLWPLLLGASPEQQRPLGCTCHLNLELYTLRPINENKASALRLSVLK